LDRPSQREYTEGQPLMANDFIKPCTKLVPPQGYRAMSISVDAAQSVAGLAVPGDYVDVLLTQNFADSVTHSPGVSGPGRPCCAMCRCSPPISRFVRQLA
jgi:Flp pilus assembly protein CpaB